MSGSVVDPPADLRVERPVPRVLSARAEAVVSMARQLLEARRSGCAHDAPAGR